MVDRFCLDTRLSSTRDEFLKRPDVDLPKQHRSDERIELLQLRRTVSDASLVPVLVQELGRGSPERVIGSQSEYARLPGIVDPSGKLFFGSSQVTRASALANSRSSDDLVDVPDPTAFDES
jgi:hypothetical protein